MIEQGLPQVDKHKVVVLTITYNHSKYIEDTLKGFAMQQTDFPFLCCVFDDASTDGEQEVLKKWIENHCNPNEIEVYDHPLTIILKAPDKMNPNCIYVIHLQKVNTWGKPEKKRLVNYWSQFGEYIALCEGDDYWIDSLKLQKQVDFLDANLDYGMIRTEIMRYIQSCNRLEEHFFTKILKTNNNDKLEDYILYGWFAAPCTWLYRTSTLKGIPVLNKQTCFLGDILLILHIASQSKIYFSHDTTAIYRVLDESASHFDSLSERRVFVLKVWNTRLYFARRQSLSFRLLFWWKTCVFQLRPSVKKELQFMPWWISHCLKYFFILLNSDTSESSMDN